MKPLRKLTRKNLLLNKSRTIVTIIGIMLSTALITVVAGMASGLLESMMETQIASTGDYDFMVCGDTYDDLEYVKSHRDIQNVYAINEIGVAYMPQPKYETKPYISLMAVTDNAYEATRTTLKEGRFPQNSSELVLSSELLKATDADLKIGDTITLDLGKRYMELEATDDNGNPTGEIERAEFSGSDAHASRLPFTTGEEEFEPSEKRTYTITGILNETNNGNISYSDTSAARCVYTFFDENSADGASIYADITADREKDYIEIVCDVTGYTEEQLLSGEKVEGVRFSAVDINIFLLEYKGIGISDSTSSMIFKLAMVIIIIIIIASVFVIRNSFAISITEKTRLYGMFASVGATPRQIRHNVFFEGFVLGLIGIPLGLLLGVGVCFALTAILNILLSEWFLGNHLVVSIPLLAVAGAVVLSALTIFFSAFGSAIKAARISAIDAIKSTKDIKAKEKKLSSPKFIKKLFGAGGVIAYKNLKRSKKKYRTTVVSIAVSVALFISISSFVYYAFDLSSYYYDEMPFNFVVNIADINGNIGKDIAEIESLIDEKDETRMVTGLISSQQYCSTEYINEEQLVNYNYGYGYSSYEESSIYFYNNVIALTDEDFKAFAEMLGYDYDEVKDKAFLHNEFLYSDDNGKKYTGSIYNYKQGMSMYCIKSESAEEYTEVEIAGVFKQSDVTDKILSIVLERAIVIRESFAKSAMTEYYDQVQHTIYINSEDPDKLEERINQLDLYSIWFENYDRTARQSNAVYVTILIFVYGFITVITLIGLTNIFNTITTNMALRSKEFAMLRSVGMTKKEFGRMIRLETLFYGIKSLLYGIPLGLLGSFAIFSAFKEKMHIDSFTVPWTAILISVAFVFVAVGLIMQFSLVKARRQNIIEAIRNDNI